MKRLLSALVALAPLLAQTTARQGPPDPNHKSAGSHDGPIIIRDGSVHLDLIRNMSNAAGTKGLGSLEFELKPLSDAAVTLHSHCFQREIRVRQWVQIPVKRGKLYPLNIKELPVQSFRLQPGNKTVTLTLKSGPGPDRITFACDASIPGWRIQPMKGTQGTGMVNQGSLPAPYGAKQWLGASYTWPQASATEIHFPGGPIGTIPLPSSHTHRLGPCYLIQICPATGGCITEPQLPACSSARLPRDPVISPQ